MFNSSSPVEGVWKSIREHRNTLLAQTDWTVSNNSTLSPVKIEEYRVYRQALRDLPQTYTNPNTIVWPTKPA